MNASWPYVPLGKVLIERREIPSDEALTQGEIPIIEKIAFDEGRIYLRNEGTTKTNMILIRPGDLVISGINAAKGAIAIYGEENREPIAATIHYSAYIPNHDKVDIRYLWWLLRSNAFRKLLLKYVPGGIKTELKAKRFLPVPVPLPPLTEQRQIVAHIEKLSSNITKVRRLRQNAAEKTKALFGCVLKELWSDKGDWSVKPLGELATTVSGQVDPKMEPYASMPHINGECIESGTCRLLQYRLAKEDGVKSGKYHFRPYSILYSKIRPYLKKAVQIPFEGICSADIYAFDDISEEIEPRFLMYSLVAPDFCQYADSLSGRTRMPKLNQQQLFAFKIVYPSRKRQLEIVKYLDKLQTKINELKILQAKTFVEVDAILPSFLSKTFNR